MQIGAHVSSSNSIEKSIERAHELGAETLQIFASAPQSWRTAEHADSACDAFRRRASECSMDRVFLHAIYLINLAAKEPAHLTRSIGSLKLALQTAGRIGARGAVVHTGSHMGRGFESVFPQIIGALHDVLNDTPESTWVILENSAGMGGSIGSQFAELGTIIRAAGSDRVKVCLDTCHALAAGYEIRTPHGLDATFAEFDREIGMDRLVVIHANDSKVDLGGGKDRHENIGEGYIGLEGFASMIAHPVFTELPLILEVPGFDGGGPDQRNIQILRELREKHLAR
jgi:deoxyribonuclease-4